MALGPGASALYLALHAVQHGRNEALTLDELELALSRLTMDRWREAAAVARRIGAMAVFATGLRMTPAGQAVADELRLPESPTRRVLLSAEDANRPARYLDDLSHLKGVRARLAFLRTVLFPPRSVMAEQRFGDRGRFGLAVAYGWRLIRGLGRLPAALTASPPRLQGDAVTGISGTSRDASRGA